jgi:hypothetical protein
MVGIGGLEPPTSRLSGVRSNQLSYTPRDDSNFPNLVVRYAACGVRQKQPSQPTTHFEPDSILVVRLGDSISDFPARRVFEPWKLNSSLKRRISFQLSPKA